MKPATNIYFIGERVDAQFFDYFFGDSYLFEPIGVDEYFKVSFLLTYFGDYIL